MRAFDNRFQTVLQTDIQVTLCRSVLLQSWLSRSSCGAAVESSARSGSSPQGGHASTTARSPTSCDRHLARSQCDQNCGHRSVGIGFFGSRIFPQGVTLSAISPRSDLRPH